MYVRFIKIPKKFGVEYQAFIGPRIQIKSALYTIGTNTVNIAVNSINGPFIDYSNEGYVLFYLRGSSKANDTLAYSIPEELEAVLPFTEKLINTTMRHRTLTLRINSRTKRVK